MQWSTHKAMLFGGAVFAAGIVNVSHAQWTLDPYPPIPTGSYVRAESINSGLIVADGGSGFHTAHLNLDSYNDTDISGVMRSYVTESLIGAYMNIGPGLSGLTHQAYGDAYLNATVTSDQPLDVLVEWSFEGATGGSWLEGWITSQSVGDIFVTDDGGVAGSLVVPMLANDQWIISIRLLDTLTPTEVWVRFTVIPGPATLALLGTAGLFGTARRRRT